MKRLLCSGLLFLFVSAGARADVFRILDDPRDAAQARVDIIQQAKSEIHALYFLARDDRITMGALALLRDAKRRGVGSVRLVVDANFNRIPKGVLAHLREEGVEVKVYHPVTIKHPSWLLRRMHEKVVIVDRQRYVAGGRNLAEAYFGLARKNYVDRDVYVEGASAIDADDHFASVWTSKHVSKLRVRVTAREKRRAIQVLDNALRDLEHTGLVALDTGNDWSANERQVAAVRFLHDPPSPRRGPRLAVNLAQILADAKCSIVIESPYLVPSKALLDIFERKLREGVTITILTNSLRSTDGVLPQAGYYKYRRRLAEAGVELREYKGPDALHAKSAVVDGRIAMIGSYNIDPRSQNLNTEVMCVVEDEVVAAALLASIESHTGNAWHLDRAAVPYQPEGYPGVGRRRLFGVRAVMFLLPIVEKQL